MGWFGSNMSRKELIAELTKVEVKDIDQQSFLYTTLKHCYRGNSHSGILWSILEKRDVTDKSRPPALEYRLIRCDLLECRGGKWWHKPMIEASHPYYYSCPKKYLELTADSPPATQCAEWREKVRQYHEMAAHKRLLKKQLAARY